MTLRNHYGLFQRLAIVFCLFSTVSAAATQPAHPKARAVGHTICVVSLIGQKFAVQTIGLMVFGNKLEAAAISSWGIDDLVARKVGAAVGHDFTVRRFVPPASAAAAYNRSPGLFHNHYYDFVAALRGHTTGCRYLVIAAPRTAEFSSTNQTIEGLGIVRHSAIIDQYFLHAVFTVHLYDGQTLEHLSAYYSVGSWFGTVLGDPLGQRTVDKSWWPESAQAAARNAKLRDGTRALVLKALDTEVRDLIPTLSQRR